MLYQYRKILFLLIVLQNFSLAQSVHNITETVSDVTTYWAQYQLPLIDPQDYLLTQEKLDNQNPDFLANTDPAAFYLRDDYFDYKCPVNGVYEDSACTLKFNNNLNIIDAGNFQNYLYIKLQSNVACPPPLYYNNNSQSCMSNIYLGNYRTASFSNGKVIVNVPSEVLKTQDLNIDNRPDWNTGILYFSNQDGSIRHKCDATTIGEWHIILTAAHCVVDDDGNMYTNFMFVSAKSRGTTEVLKVSYPNDYINAMLPYKVAYDYAFLRIVDQVTPGYLGFTVENFSFEHGINEVLATVSNVNSITAYMNVDMHPTIPHVYQFSYLQQRDAVKIPGAIMVKQLNNTSNPNFGNLTFSVLSSVTDSGVAFSPVFDNKTSETFHDVFDQ